jgi:hypothetical protein
MEAYCTFVTGGLGGTAGGILYGDPTTFCQMFELLRIPRSALSELFRDWVGFRDLCRLDSAVCCGSERSQLLNFFRSSALVVSITDLSGGSSEGTSSLIEWLIRRGIKGREWVLDGDSEPRLIGELAANTGGPHVRSLHLSNAKEETAGILSTVFAKCKKIVNVRIENSEHWTGLSAVRGEAELSLQELSVVNCGTGSALHFKRSNFANLERLYLVGGYTANTVLNLLAAAPNLKDLRLRHTPVNNTVFELLVTRSQSLHTLMLLGCGELTIEAVSSLVPGCVSLKTLVVSSCHKLTSIASFAHCKLLERLQVDVTNTQGLSEIARSCGATLLQLSLVNLKFSGDEDLLVVAEHCKRLTELELCRCRGVTAVALVQLVSSLSALKELILDECDAVTDTVLIAIAEHLPQLEFLGLFKSSGYTENGALALIKLLRSLRKLAIDSQHVIFSHIVMSLWQERMPGLEVCGFSTPTTNCRELHSWG